MSEFNMFELSSVGLASGSATSKFASSRPGTLLIAVAVAAASVGCGREAARRDQDMQARAETQVAAFAARLRQAMDDTASYVRLQPAEVKERDPWGRLLELSYTQGGLSESFEVRSYGADREPHTADDIVETGTLVNLKGVGRALREGAEETAQNTARGVVKGAAEGAKEAVAEGAKSAKEKFSDAAAKLKEKFGGTDDPQP